MTENKEYKEVAEWVARIKEELARRTVKMVSHPAYNPFKKRGVLEQLSEEFEQ